MDWNYSILPTLTTYNVVLYTSLLAMTWWLYRNMVQPFLSPLRKIPGKPYRPIVGNMFEATRAEAMSNAVRWMTELNSLTIRFYYLNGQERLLTADPQAFRHILVTNSKNYERLRSRSSGLQRIVGKGILFVNGEEHHNMRKLLNPAFGPKVLMEMIPVFEMKARKVSSIWCDLLSESKESTKVIQVQDFLTRITLDSICEIGLDHHPDAISQPEAASVTIFSRLFMEAAKVKLISVIPFYLYLPTEENIRGKNDLRFVTDTVKRTIEAKRSKVQSQSNEKDMKAPKDLLSILLVARDEDGNSMDEDLIEQNVLTMLVAGYETTSVGLTWVMLQLAQYPDIQKKVREELKMLIPDPAATLTFELLDKLHYLTCVIKETLRLFPPVSNITRCAIDDDTISGYRIPAGTIINLHIGALHRMPQNWENPETFCPERFMDSDIGTYKFLPFIAGPHTCIGNKFAMLEMKTVLAIIIRDFEFSMAPGYKYRRIQGVTVKPNPPLLLQVRKICDTYQE